MNRFNKPVSITEPTLFDEGNNRFTDMVNPDLHSITLAAAHASPCAFHGVKQNGVQIDPHNPPANITIESDDIDWFFTHNHVQYEKDPWDKITQFKGVLEAKQAGEDAWLAWVWIVDQCQEHPTADKAIFLAGYEAQDFVAYQGFILKAIDAIFSTTGYEAIRDAINTQPRDRLVGEETEIVEVFE